MAWDTWVASASVLDCVPTQDRVRAALPDVVAAVLAQLARLSGRPRRGGPCARATGSSPKSPVQGARVFAGGADDDGRKGADDNDDDDEDDDDDDDDDLDGRRARLRGIARDTLHQAAQLLGVAAYARVVLPLADCEAGLFGLAAAGDVALCDRATREGAAGALPRGAALRDWQNVV